MADLTGKRIKDTYTGLVQVVSGVIQDGTGSTLNIPFGQLTGAGTLVSSSTQISSDISGSITSFSSSISSKVSTNETNISALQSFSSSLDATYATDAQVSTAVSSLNAATSSYLTSIDPGIISSSTQISDFGFISSSHTDIAALNLFTGSVQLEVDSLNAATSSYLTSIDAGIISSSTQISDFGFISSSHTDISALNTFTGSIQSEVDSLNSVTGSYITSASLAANYVSKAKLLAAATGSTTFNEFTGSLLTLLS